ncbi:unnamed protein product [Knipowitschia caucasica]|uniref:Serine/threonine-protein kinase 1 n=1 Tax=Knipowitschia caucasica TaxID=637954 RepID=A0AAV2K1U5_KNICA
MEMRQNSLRKSLSCPDGHQQIPAFVTSLFPSYKFLRLTRSKKTPGCIQHKRQVRASVRKHLPAWTTSDGRMANRKRMRPTEEEEDVQPPTKRRDSLPLVHVSQSSLDNTDTPAPKRRFAFPWPYARKSSSESEDSQPQVSKSRFHFSWPFNRRRSNEKGVQNHRVPERSDTQQITKQTSAVTETPPGKSLQGEKEGEEEENKEDEEEEQEERPDVEMEDNSSEFHTPHESVADMEIGSDPLLLPEKEEFPLRLDVLKEIEDKYLVMERLEEGYMSIVLKGLRREDLTPVALKKISRKYVQFVKVKVNKELLVLPLEVFMLLKVGAGSGSEGITPQLLDWYDAGQYVYLVFQRPIPCEDLLDYVFSKDRIRNLTFTDVTHDTKIIMRQLVDAAIEMEAKGVFHLDIKPQNVLIQKYLTPKAKFIDFGSAKLLHHKDQLFHEPQGSLEFSSPEWFREQQYKAGPTTVWQLGLVMFVLLLKRVPLVTEKSVASWTATPIPKNIPQECRLLLKGCLDKDPETRLTLEQMRDHTWLQEKPTWS